MRYILPTICIGLSVTTQAQWNPPDQNTLVRAGGEYGSLAGPTLTSPGPDGSTYISWYDGGSFNLRMQRLDVNGVKMWGPNGVVVDDEAQATFTARYDLHTDQAGNAVIALQDARDGELDIAAYKVDPSGNPLWGANGIPLRATSGTGLAPSVGILSDDRVVVAWQTNATPATVAFQILSEDGTPAWSTPREIADTISLFGCNVVPRNDGGFWIQYTRALTNSFPPIGKLSTRRFDVAGGQVDVPLDVFTGETYTYYFTKPVSDGHNGFYMGITEFNPDAPNLFTVAVQRVRSNGSLWSPAGSRVVGPANSQEFLSGGLPALVNDDAGVMLGFTRGDVGQTISGVTAQRFDTAGTRMFGDNGIDLIAPTADQFQCSGNSATTQGMVTIFRPSATFNTQTLLAVHLKADGTMAWSPNTIDVSSVLSEKGFAHISPFVNGQAVVAWIDWRSAAGVYAQPIREGNAQVGISEVNEEGPAHLLGVPGDAPELMMARATGALTLSIHAADGRLMEQRTLTPRAAGQRTLLTQRELPAGLYHVVLQGSEGRQVLRWVKP